MAKMAFAFCAAHFGADHAVAGVGQFLNRGSFGGRGIAGPARSAVIFGAAVEQRFTASGAAIHAVALMIGIFAGESTLGAALAQHVAGHRVEVGIGFHVGHGG